jgi:hypothetical protein
MTNVMRVCELPSWFSLKSYDSLLKLTLEELYAEILIRQDAYIREGCADYFLCALEYSGPIQAQERIQAGYGDLPPLCVLLPQLSKARSVRPVSSSRLSAAYQLSSSFGGDRPYLDTFLDAFSSQEVRKRREGVISEPHRLTVMADIALEGASDAEILSELASLLPQWRRQLSIPEPKGRNLRMGEQILARIITQRSIPLLDLLIWQKHTGAAISSEVLARVLFDDNASQYPEAQLIKKTYIPAALKLITEEYLSKAATIIRNDSALASRIVADHLAILGQQYP